MVVQRNARPGSCKSDYFSGEVVFFPFDLSGSGTGAEQSQVSPDPQQPPDLSIDFLIADKNPFFFFSSAMKIHLK